MWQSSHAGLNRSGVECVELNWFREFGADPLAGDPADERIGALAAWQDQPDPASDFELAVGLGHEAGGADIEDARLIALAAQFADASVEIDRKTRVASAVGEGSVVVDGPTVYLWGLVLVFALAGVALFAERKVEAGLSVFAGQAAALPGTEAERQSAGMSHTEVYPLVMFAVGGMLLFPASGDLLTMFVALEVLSLPLYLLCGLARRRRLLTAHHRGM